MAMEEIVIPNLDDDDEDDIYPAPRFGKHGFGSGSTSSLTEAASLPYAHRSQTSGASSHQPKLSSSSSYRPTPSKPSTSYGVGGGHNAIPSSSSVGHTRGGESFDRPDRPRLGKFSNGSQTSLAGMGLPTPSGANVPVPRKGSLASLKNAFKASAPGAPASPIPPVPSVDARRGPSAAGYPALRNPFSRTPSGTPASPSNAFHSSVSPMKPSRMDASPGPTYHTERKQSFASQRSIGGRSATSNGSSNFRAEDFPMPSLPSIPPRGGPSRTGRHGSDGDSIFSGFAGSGRRKGSVLGMEEIIEGGTPIEEALRVVFKRFKDAADSKLSRICSRPLNTQPSLQAHLEKGIDAELDKAVEAVAQCGHRHARRVHDLLQSWCDGHCRGIGAAEVRSHLDRSLGLQMRVEDAAAILSARKIATARYIFVRAVVELLQVTQKDDLGEELGMTIEVNAFNAYRSESLDVDVQSPHKRAVSQLQVDLLGELSRTRFLTVTHRFISEITKYANSASAKDSEARIEHLLRGMRTLKLRVYPEAELELAAELLESLAALFVNAHGQPLKLAYMDTFTQLLHPVVETATAEVNHPMWAKAVAVILQRATVMAAKARYWAVAFPLVVTTLGVSTREVFMQQWQTSIDGVIARLKDKPSRQLAMSGLARLLWIYLNRCSESATSTRKRLDGVLRILFFANGPLWPPDLPFDAFVLILHFAITRQLDQGEDLLSEFLNGVDIASTTDSAILERLTALVRALILSLTAVADDRQAKWPPSADLSMLSLDGYEAAGDLLAEDALTRQGVPELLTKTGPALAGLLLACDRGIGNLLLSSDAVSISTHTSSHSIDNTEMVYKKHGDVQVMYPARHGPTLRLLAALLDAMPRCYGPKLDLPAIAQTVCRATFSAEPKVSGAGTEAMKRLSHEPNHCVILINAFREFIFETRHVFRDTFIGARSLESQFERVVTVWLDLVRTHLIHTRLDASAADDNALQVSSIKVEASGLFLLCSSSLALRKLGVQALEAARELDGVAPVPSLPFRYSRILPTRSSTTRAIQLLEHDATDSEVTAIRALPGFTTTDRSRLDAVTHAGKEKLLLCIIEGDQSKSHSLWLAVLPYFVEKLVQGLPDSAAELRISVITAVLRIQGYVALVATQNSGMGGQAHKQAPGVRGAVAPRTATDILGLADQWRAYMTVLVVTAPGASTSPTSPPVQRTKDAIILTPDTIGTAALFYYLATLLAWEDPRFRDVAIYALGATGPEHVQRLVDILLATARRLSDGIKLGSGMQTHNHTRRGGPLRASQNPLWTTVSHVFRFIAPLMLDARSPNYLHNLSATITFVKITLSLLSDDTVKEDFDLQSLRRSFCMVVEQLTNALGKLDSSERFLGAEARSSIFTLCYEWCTLGHRHDIAKAKENQIIQAAAAAYRGERDRAAYLDDLQAKTKLLSVAAAEAMAGLCQGKLVSFGESDQAGRGTQEQTVDPFLILRWIRGVFASGGSGHPIGRKALYALLQFNSACNPLLDEVLHQSFGEGEQFGLDASFYGTLSEVLGEGLVTLPTEQLICLTLSKLGHPASGIRLRAFRTCLSLLSGEALASARSLYPAVGSGSSSVHLQAQKQLSGLLSAVYHDITLPFVAECTSRLSQLEAPRRSATLRIIPAWLSDLELNIPADSSSAESTAVTTAEADKALSNLLYVAVRFFDDHLEQVQDIFHAFAGSARSANATSLIKFLFEQGCRRRSSDFVTYSQKVLASLAASPAAEAIFDDVCEFIEPAAMAGVAEAEAQPMAYDSLADLDQLLSASSRPPQTFSTGQLAFLFAGELLPYRIDDAELGKRLPMLLHVALVLSDSPNLTVREGAQSIFFQILRAWICRAPPDDAHDRWSGAEARVNAFARESRESLFWRTEDGGAEGSAFFAPAKMTSLVLRVMGTLLPVLPDIKQTWGELALQWATSCPIRHIACRSFQILRMLTPRISARMISDILARLSSTIASTSSEIQEFNVEIIRTFAGMAESLTSDDMLRHPQIFWCAVACMGTPFEDEYLRVLELFSHVLDKTNLSDPEVVEEIMRHEPPNWVGSPPRLQSLLIVGLRSSRTVMLAFDLIRRLASAAETDLIDAPEDRLLHGFLPALPWMLHSLDVGEPNGDLSAMALDLAAMADQAGNSGFSRLLTSFAHARFRTKDDFIKQAGSFIRDWLPTHALEIITILLGFTLNSENWLCEKALLVLKMVLASPAARQPLAVHGGELLQPLLRLVSTKHSAAALDLLDVPGSRAATTEARSSSMMATGELFGPVSESGWSVAHAQDAADITRENVSAVFDTCETETRAASRHFSVLQFADMKGFDVFERTDFALPTDQRVPDLPDGIDRGKGIGMTAENASMSDLVGALHSLGQFFDDHLDDASSPAIGRGHARLPSETPSERRVRAIVGRARQPSVSSPVFEHQYQHSGGRHRHTRSGLTESSLASTDLDGDTSREPEAAPRFNSVNSMSRPTASELSLSQSLGSSGSQAEPYNTSQHGRHPSSGGSATRPPASRRERHLKPSVSSISGVSDYDRSEALFSLDEGAD